MMTVQTSAVQYEEVEKENGLGNYVSSYNYVRTQRTMGAKVGYSIYC